MNPAYAASAASPSGLVSTEEIQKKLDYNQVYIFTILDAQKKGDVARITELQKKLQENLVELATIADQYPNLTQLKPQGKS